MNYGTISRKSSGKGKSARLPIGLCLLFLAVYFSFFFFFPYTPSTTFFLYLKLLFAVSVLTSLVYSFFTRKAWIPLAVQILFGVICTVNYMAYQSDMQDKLAATEKQIEEIKKQAEAQEKAFRHTKIDLAPGEKARIALTNMQLTPLPISQKNWRSQVMSLTSLQFSDNPQYPENKSINGEPGWLVKNTLVSGCYFGLSYNTAIYNRIMKGIVKTDGSPEGNLIFTNNNIVSSHHNFYQWNSFITDKKQVPGTITLSFSADLALSNNKSAQTTLGSATWKYIPPLVPSSKKKALEFR